MQSNYKLHRIAVRYILMYSNEKEKETRLFFCLGCCGYSPKWESSKVTQGANDELANDRVLQLFCREKKASASGGFV